MKNGNLWIDQKRMLDWGLAPNAALLLSHIVEVAKEKPGKPLTVVSVHERMLRSLLDSIEIASALNQLWSKKLIMDAGKLSGMRAFYLSDKAQMWNQPIEKMAV